MTAPTLGFLGLGIMGKAMASNLIKAGYTVTVWNRSQGKVDELVQHGAKAASSPAEVVKHSQITFAMLADPAAALEVAFGGQGKASEGALAAINKDKVYVDCSTVDEDCSKKIAEGVAKAGGRFLEAPVSGSKMQAEGAQLIFMCAGDRTVYDETAELLKKMGKVSHFLGDVGAAARMKLVLNMVMGSMVCALGEGISLAESAGLSSASLVEIIGQGAMACPMTAAKGKAMVEHNYPTNFPLKHQEKDLRLALELAAQVGVAPTPVASAAHSQYKLASASGHADKDFAAVRELVGNKAEVRPGIFSCQ
eukprot:m.10247 g.10247  ORF g.10247 m.10247 type:complete len:308 (+) comp5162_c0_seq1:89-1012(+)